MSMYPTKGAMIEAMQAEIDSLKAQLAEARKDGELPGFWIIRTMEQTKEIENDSKD